MKPLSVNCVILKIMNVSFSSNHETFDFYNMKCFNQIILDITLFLCLAHWRKSLNKMTPSETEIINKTTGTLAERMLVLFGA